MSKPSLDTVIKRCLKNEVRAQEELYKLTYEALFNCALRYGKDKEEGQWIFNLAMLKIFNSLDRFKLGTNYLGWATTIIVRSSINYLRQNINHEKMMVRVDNDDYVNQGFELNEGLNRLEAERILELIQTLPDRERLVFSMYEIDGYTHVDIEAETGIKKNTSKWLLASAKKTLRKEVSMLYELKPCSNE